MKLVIVLVLALALAGPLCPAMAEIPVKAAIAYNCDGNNPEEAIGIAVKQDLFIKGIDVDLFAVSKVGETLINNEQAAMGGLSYNYDVNKKLGVFAGAGMGLKRFEKLEDHRYGESDRYVYGGISYSF